MKATSDIIYNQKISFLAESIAVWLTLMDRILYFLYLKILFHIIYYLIIRNIYFVTHSLTEKWDNRFGRIGRIVKKIEIYLLSVCIL